MFKKKKKNKQDKIEEIKQENISETVLPKMDEEVTTEDDSKRNKLASFFHFTKKPEENKETTNGEVIHNGMITDKEGWQWTNNEEFTEKVVKEDKKKLKKQRKEESSEEVQELEPNEKRKDLSAFFEDNKDKKKIRKKEKVQKVKESTEKKDHKSKKEQIQEDVINQKVFRYDNKKYTKVEDFITYLNRHYLDIETIAEEVLENENFFGWVNKNSGMFKNSLKEFKEIKAKIENKS